MDSISLFSQNSARSMSPRTQTRNLSGPSSPKLRRTFNLFKTARFPSDVVEIPKKAKTKSQSDGYSFDSILNYSLSSFNFYTEPNDEANSSILFSNLDDSAQNVKNEYLQVLSTVSDTLNQNNTSDSKKRNSLLSFSPPENQNNRFFLDKIMDSDSESLPNPIVNKMVNVDIDSDTCLSDPVFHKKLYDKSNNISQLQYHSNEPDEEKSDESNFLIDNDSRPSFLSDNNDNQINTEINDNNKNIDNNSNLNYDSKESQNKTDSNSNKNENFDLIEEKDSLDNLNDSSNNHNEFENNSLYAFEEEEENFNEIPITNNQTNSNEDKFTDQKDESSNANNYILNDKATNDKDEFTEEKKENSDTNQCVLDNTEITIENLFPEEEDKSDSIKRSLDNKSNINEDKFIENKKIINKNAFSEEVEEHSDSNKAILNNKEINNENKSLEEEEEKSTTINDILENKTSINEDEFPEEKEEPSNSSKEILNNKIINDENNFPEEEEEKSNSIIDNLDNKSSINEDKLPEEKDEKSDSNKEIFNKEEVGNENEFPKEEKSDENNKILNNEEINNEKRSSEDEKEQSNTINDILSDKSNINKDDFKEEEGTHSDPINSNLIEEASFNEDEFIEEEEEENIDETNTVNNKNDTKDILNYKNEEEFLGENPEGINHLEDFSKNKNDFLFPEQLSNSFINTQDEKINDTGKKEELSNENNENINISKADNNNLALPNNSSNFIQVIERNINSNEIIPKNVQSNEKSEENTNKKLCDTSCFEENDEANNNSNNNNNYKNDNNSNNETNNESNNNENINNNDNGNGNDNSRNDNNNNDNNNNKENENKFSNSNLNETEFVFPLSPIFKCPPLFEKTIRNTIKITATSNYSPKIKSKLQINDRKIDGTSLMRKSHYFKDFNGILTFVKTEHPEFSDEPPFKDFNIKDIREKIGWTDEKEKAESMDVLSDDDLQFHQQQKKIDKNYFSSDYNDFDDFDDFHTFINNDTDFPDLKKEKKIFRSSSILSDFLSTDIMINDNKFFRSSSALSSDIFLSDYAASDLSLSSDDDDIVFNSNYPTQTVFQNINIEKNDSTELKSQQNQILPYHDDQHSCYNICKIIKPNNQINMNVKTDNDDYFIESENNDFQIFNAKFINNSINEFKIDELPNFLLSKSTIQPSFFRITFSVYVDRSIIDYFDQYKPDYYDNSFLNSFILEKNENPKISNSLFTSNFPEDKPILSISNDKFSVLQEKKAKINNSNFYINSTNYNNNEDSFYVEINKENSTSNSPPLMYPKDEYKCILLEDSILIDEFEFLNIEDCGIDDNRSMDDEFVSTGESKVIVKEDSFKIIKNQTIPVIKISDFSFADFSMKELNNFLIKEEKHLHFDLTNGSKSYDILENKQHFNISNPSNYNASNKFLLHKIKSENYKHIYDDKFSIFKEKEKYKIANRNDFIDSFPFQKKFTEQFQITKQTPQFVIKAPPKSFYSFIHALQYIDKDNDIFQSDEINKNSIKSESSFIAHEKWFLCASEINDTKFELVSKTDDYQCNELNNKNRLYVEKQIDTKFIKNEEEFKVNNNDTIMRDMSPILSSEHSQDNPKLDSFISKGSLNYINKRNTFNSPQARKKVNLIKTGKDFCEFLNKESKTKMAITSNFKSNVNDNIINQEKNYFTSTTSSYKLSFATLVSSISSTYKDNNNEFISIQDDFKLKLQFGFESNEFQVKEQYIDKPSTKNKFIVSDDLKCNKENSFISKVIHNNPAYSSFIHKFNYSNKNNVFKSEEAATNRPTLFDREINIYNNIEFENRFISSNKHETEIHDNLAIYDPVSFNSTKVINNLSHSAFTSDESFKYTNVKSKTISTNDKYNHQTKMHDKALSVYKNREIKNNKCLPSTSYVSYVHDIIIESNKFSFKTNKIINNPSPSSYVSYTSNDFRTKTNMFVSDQAKNNQNSVTEKIFNEFRNKLHDSNKHFPSTNFSSKVPDSLILQEENAFYSNEIFNKPKSLTFNHNSFKTDEHKKEECVPIPKLKSIVHYTSLHPQRAVFSVHNNLIYINKENIFDPKVPHKNPISSSSFISNDSIVYSNKYGRFDSIDKRNKHAYLISSEFKNEEFDNKSISPILYGTTIHDYFAIIDTKSFNSIKTNENNTISSSDFMTNDSQKCIIKNNLFISEPSTNNQLILAEKRINKFENDEFELQKSVSTKDNLINIHDDYIIINSNDFNINKNLRNPTSNYKLNDSVNYTNKFNEFISIQTRNIQRLQIKQSNDIYLNKVLIARKSDKMPIRMSYVEDCFIAPKSIMFNSYEEIRSPKKTSLISNDSPNNANKLNNFVSVQTSSVQKLDRFINKNTDEFIAPKECNSFFISPSPYLSNNFEFKIKTEQTFIFTDEIKIDKSTNNEPNNNNTISLRSPKSRIQDSIQNADKNSFSIEPSPYLSNNFGFKIKTNRNSILTKEIKIDRSAFNESNNNNTFSLNSPKSLIQDSFKNMDSNSFYSESSPYLTNNPVFKIKSESAFILENKPKADTIIYSESVDNNHISFISPKSLMQDNFYDANHNSFHPQQSQYLSDDIQHKCKNENFLVSPNKQNPTKFINNESKNNIHSTSTSQTILDHELPKNSKQSSFNSPITPYLLDNSEYVSKDGSTFNKTKLNKYISNESNINKSNSTNNHKIVSHENFKNTNGSTFQPAQSQFQLNKFNSKNESKYVLFDKKESNGFICDENKANKSVHSNDHLIFHSIDFRNTDKNSFRLESTPYHSDNFQFTNKTEDNKLPSVSKSSFISSIETQQFNNQDSFNSINDTSKSQIINPIIQVKSQQHKDDEKKIIFSNNKPIQSQFSSLQNQKGQYLMKNNEFKSNNAQDNTNNNSQFKTIVNDFHVLHSFNSLPQNQISTNTYKIPHSIGSFKPGIIRIKPVIQRSIIPDSFIATQNIITGKTFSDLTVESEINSSNIFKNTFEEDEEEYTEEEMDNDLYPINYYNLDLLRSDYEEEEEENRNEYSEIIRFGEINVIKKEFHLNEKPKQTTNQSTQTYVEKAQSIKSDKSIQSKSSTSKKSTKSKSSTSKKLTKSKSSTVKKSPQSQQGNHRIRRRRKVNVKKQQKEIDQISQKQQNETETEIIIKKQTIETEQVHHRQRKTKSINRHKRNESPLSNSSNQHKTSNNANHHQHRENESVSSHQHKENSINHHQHLSKESPSNNSNHRKHHHNEATSNVSNHQTKEKVSSMPKHHDKKSVSSTSSHRTNGNTSDNHHHQKVNIKLKSKESDQGLQSILKKSNDQTKITHRFTKENDQKTKTTQKTELSQSNAQQQQQQKDHHVTIKETAEKNYETQIKNFIMSPNDSRLRNEINTKIILSELLNDNESITLEKPYVIHKKDQITYKMFYRQVAFPLVPSENEFFSQFLEQISQPLRLNRQFSSLIEMIDQYLKGNDTSYIDLYPLNTSILVDRYPLILGELIESKRNGEKLKEMNKKCKLLINGTFLVICSQVQSKTKMSKKSSKNNESESSEKKVFNYAVKNCSIKENKNKKSIIVKSNDAKTSGFLNQNYNELKLRKNEFEYVYEIELKSNNKEVISEWLHLNNKLRDKRSTIEYYLAIIAYYSFFDLNSNRFDKIKEFDNGLFVKSTSIEITYETIQKAVIGPNLYLSLFLLNQSKPNKKIISFVFKLFVNSNRHDFLIRTLFLSEVSTSPPSLVFQIPTVYTRPLLLLFTSPSIDWITSFVQKVERISISPSIFLKMLLKEMNSLSQESLYIIRSILILSFLVYGDNVSSFKIFILFVKNAILSVINNANTVRTMQSFFSQIHINIGNKRNKEFERLSNFVQIILLKTPKLSNKFVFRDENLGFEELNLPQICQLILKHVIDNGDEFLQFIENKIQNLNEEKKGKDDFHPLLFSFYQNIRFYMNFQYKYQLPIHE